MNANVIWYAYSKQPINCMNVNKSLVCRNINFQDVCVVLCVKCAILLNKLARSIIEMIMSCRATAVWKGNYMDTISSSGSSDYIFSWWSSEDKYSNTDLQWFWSQPWLLVLWYSCLFIVFFLCLFNSVPCAFYSFSMSLHMCKLALDFLCYPKDID